jgi:hypothetical protein
MDFSCEKKLLTVNRNELTWRANAVSIQLVRTLDMFRILEAHSHMPPMYL